MNLSDFGILISLIFPTFLSIYHETRFVKKGNFLVYGISLIVFFLSFTQYALPQNFSYLKYCNFIFLAVGLFMLFIYGNYKGLYDKIKEYSLFFSWKNFGAFEFAFVAPLFLIKIPNLFNIATNSILNLGLSLLIIFWAASGIFWIYRNWIKEKED